MFYVFNAFIVLLTVLIAYWWANQGLFSAIMHLLAVIIAGAVALGFWELITMNLLLRNWWLDEYAWGVGLIVPFAIVLFGVRLLFDRLAPSNVVLPHWANLVFGFAVGLIAAELTLGLFLIGAGHIQTQGELMGMDGWRRDKGNGMIAKIEEVPVWTFAPVVASEFYSRLSVGALSTSTPLRHYNPELYKQATLIRDGYHDANGRLVGKTSTVPDGVRVKEILRSTGAGQYAVLVTFDKEAFDVGGSLLLLSSAQVRLIGAASGTAPAPVAHPVGWCQATETVANSFRFDSVTHYATSVPGRESAEMLFRFRISDLRNAEPKFLQVRGTRFAVPRLNPASDLSEGELDARCFATGVTASAGQIIACEGAPPLKRDELDVDTRLPTIFNWNNKPGGTELIQVDGRKKLLSSRYAEFQSGGDRPSIKLMVDQFYENPGTRIVKLNVSRRTTADIYSSVGREAGQEATPLLVDSMGLTYTPIGFIHNRGPAITLYLDRIDRVGSMSVLPQLPDSSNQELWLIFEVTEGVELTCFRLSNVPLANMKVNVPSAGQDFQPEGATGSSAESAG